MSCETSTKANETKGTADRAQIRYIYQVLPATVIALLLTAGVERALSHFHPHGTTLYLLAALPGLPLMAMLGFFGIYIARTRDEVKRAVLVQGSLWATGATVGFATFWGNLQNYAAVPRFPLDEIFTLWWAAFGVGYLLIWRRYK